MTAPVPPAVPQPDDPRPVPGPPASAVPVPGPPASAPPSGTGQAATGSADGSAPSEPVSPVAAALARLDGVQALPLHEQPDVYQHVHAELQNALATIDHA